MDRRCVIFVCCLAFSLYPCLSRAQDVDEAIGMLNRGAYAQIQQRLGALIDSADRPVAEHITAYFETYQQTGAFLPGLRRVEELLNKWPENPYLQYVQGRFFVATGELKKGEEVLVRAIRTKGDFWGAGLELAELYVATGRYRPAEEIFSVLHNRYKSGYFTTAAELALAGRAAAGLGEYHDANEALTTALKLDATNVQSMFWHAELFRVTYDVVYAQEIYEKALAINPHRADLYVGLAQATNSYSRKEQLVESALERMPASVSALSLLAGLRILDGDYPAAETLLERALSINPSSVQALAHLAAIHHLREEEAAFASVEQQVLSINPRASDFFVTVSDILALRFQYHASAQLAQKAVQVNPRDATANATLGTGLLRLGEAQEARRYLAHSYNVDAFNLFVANTLSLLDEYEGFEALESEHFRLLIHEEEREVLGLDILEMAEACFADLSQRYPYPYQKKILLEAYQDADDFAVRIAGVPHLGLLGVSFGDVIAVRMPDAKTGGETNWARTLWHEIAHTMAIGVSRYRVPRWFTEGLSVYEEQRANPSWGREMELQFFQARDKKRLHSLQNINRGFTRPEFPGQVLLSYYHAYQVVDFIVGKYGFTAVTDLLEAFGRGLDEEVAVQQVFGMSRQALDASFHASLDARRTALEPVLRGWPDVLEGEREQSLLERVAGRAENVFLRQLQEGNKALDEQKYTEAEMYLEQALKMYPAFVGPGNAYLALATIYRERGQGAKLITILAEYLAVADYGAKEARELAELYADNGDSDQALKYLRRSRFVAPHDRSALTRMAELLEERGLFGEAVRVRRAVLALNPVDRADAYYRLGWSLYKNADIAAAKRAVLQSLELAPGFRDAQRLLLACTSEES